MSLPSHGWGSTRRGRAASSASRSSAPPMTGSPDSHSALDNASSSIRYGSFNDHHESQRPAPNPVTPNSYREPTRSSIHLSYRGASVPIDSAQLALSVREDTAELASYGLSDRGSVHNGSPQPRRPIQTHLESYFPGDSDTELSRQNTIEEVPEPISPEESTPADGRPGTSALTDMLRRSPPSLDGNLEQGNLAVKPGSIQEDERTPLLERHHDSSNHDQIPTERDLERQEITRTYKAKLRDSVRIPLETHIKSAWNVLNPRHWERRVIWQNAVVAPVGYLPAVILGLLLNILDALSYGMILFPLGQPIFEKLGSAGISMFYISCIISQLVYSCGGSRFTGGIGSEMIEVVPFFHKMAFTIMEKVGEDNPKAVIATTITSYAISSILTGIVFFLMGIFKCGYIVGFIPRHILTGCIGGVGWFLIATGFEVSARLDGNLDYNFDTLRKLFEGDTVALWSIPFILAVILYRLQRTIKNRYLLPVYILTIPAIFYFFALSLDELDLNKLTRDGWVFEGPEAGEPWWYFYTLYDFKIVHWGAIADTIPAMFALTFFGILHVPINVPSLAFSIGEDNLSLDRELIAHGLSNALSGFAGSIQNYLVYANSVLFYRSGGDSRVAGVMLAVFTGGVLVIGPATIGYIPVMMVGVLIFVLGFELFLEAVWEPRKKLNLLEYLTVVTIVLVMGIYDFVTGIFIGIGLAFLSLVVFTSRVPAIRASHSGEIAGSTVRRNPTQHGYLRKAGQQIHITKLVGYLFFGTIVSVEERLRALIDDEAFHARPIRFLVLDLYHVTGIDYSAAEAFNRVNRIFSKKGVTLVITGVVSGGPLSSSLFAVGLGQDGNEVKLFAELNSALEFCENQLLKTLYMSKEARTLRNAPTYLDVPGQDQQVHHSIDAQFSSPRRNHLQNAAISTLAEIPGESRYASFKEPLRLILQSFQGLTSQNEDFWFRAVPYFTRKEYLAGTIIYHCGEQADGFYLLETGILRADYELPQGRYFESIVAGTTCGELPFFSETARTATVQAERDAIAWLMDRENWEKLQKAEPDVAQELLRISLKLTSERMSTITSYVLTIAG
ncbi:cAMP-binding protein [Venustampulla echinocandica]|uniref:cAMP-binding protein n=1 Tax=Venustampulla echinocandica TaxID=2656787 RepID=A0A370U2H3_9HELO|nr:cAMP-binding protein [Venustampulla echinocandica]RDL41955.1 cAMP-binding protein [Venustampulla echinocandica]